jgi:hypothetical protein
VIGERQLHFRLAVGDVLLRRRSLGRGRRGHVVGPGDPTGVGGAQPAAAELKAKRRTPGASVWIAAAGDPVQALGNA